MEPLPRNRKRFLHPLFVLIPDFRRNVVHEYSVDEEDDNNDVMVERSRTNDDDDDVVRSRPLDSEFHTANDIFACLYPLKYKIYMYVFMDQHVVVTLSES
jgi:hypothetical protein